MRAKLVCDRLKFLLLIGVVVFLQGCAEAVVMGGMGTLVALHDARSTEHWYQDQSIEKDARRLLDKDSSLDGHSDIDITSYNRQVLLTGTVQSKSLSKRAAKQIAGIKNVRKVFNELVVEPRTNGNATDNDGMLATKIKAKLFFQDFDATRVKVISSSGHVYLMGLVSHAESDKVVAMLNDFEGVSDITKIFEYVD